MKYHNQKNYFFDFSSNKHSLYYYYNFEIYYFPIIDFFIFFYPFFNSNEECAKAEDMGNFYRVPADNRSLNYDKFFTEGDHKVETVEEYHSHNTKRLDVEGMKELLLKLNFIREDLGLQPRAKARDYRSE